MNIIVYLFFIGSWIFRKHHKALKKNVGSSTQTGETYYFHLNVTERLNVTAGYFPGKESVKS